MMLEFKKVADNPSVSLQILQGDAPMMKADHFGPTASHGFPRDETWPVSRIAPAALRPCRADKPGSI